MLSGVLYALGAGLVWGMVFITPLLLADYPGIVLSLGRYLAFGLIALIPAWLGRRRVAQLTRADWTQAFKLALIGNLVYYALLASAIQKAGVLLPTMIIGTLPVVIAVCSNLLPGHASETISWRRLAPSLVIIGTGLLLVNASELANFKLMQDERSSGDYAAGCLLAIGAVLAWTWYPIVNARYLKAHPQTDAIVWATAQGLATLPLALIGIALHGAYTYAGIAPSATGFDFPLGPQPQRFIGLMLLIGLMASWLGTLLWNQASVRLPTSLVAQLIVFETMFALLYAFILRGALPNVTVATGIALLGCGVVFGVRAFRHQMR
jgi:drug/metabolite transporter (DMT)-like permease